MANEKSQIPEAVMAMCMALVMEKVPMQGAMESTMILVNSFKEAKNDEERVESLAAHFYGILSYGFYLGMEDTLNVLTELADEWDKAGRPDNFLRDNAYKSIFGVN